MKNKIKIILLYILLLPNISYLTILFWSGIIGNSINIYSENNMIEEYIITLFLSSIGIILYYIYKKSKV